MESAIRNGQVVHYGIHDFFAVFKRSEINAGNMALNFGDCFENVLNPESPIPRQH
jgi:hypothetical protein